MKKYNGDVIYYGILTLVILFALSQQGCSWGEHATGWRFEIGVAPVQQLNNQAGLKQAPYVKETN